MKIILAAPNFPQPRGNTVTVQRISDNLQKLGVETTILSTTGDAAAKPLPEADLVHGFHAYQFYQFMKKLAVPPEKYVVTLTGTDLNLDLFDKDKRKDVLSSLRGASAVHVFDEQAKGILVEELPEIAGKISVIAQGNSVFSEMDAPALKEPDTFLFILPAGIRKVKNVPEAIEMLAGLHKVKPELRLWIVGPVLEESEGEMVLRLVQKYRDWVSYLGQLPHSSMGSLYGQADVLLNTSLAEGQPAAILEAMGYGCAVLVSDVQGNNGIVSHMETGLLYKSPSEFMDYAELLMENSGLRRKVGMNAKKRIAEKHSGQNEAEKFLEIYNNLLN
ncbi:Alpha-monoglucosyldiacylglycerol synthase [Planococcus massiliensis]|uniref:Alpha-monoglucosyldiacylglycerol synthase n=1 Tax=Planococcus massiliensis TaxID=1499687 RepID=A0A098EGE9_9BACL|nr:glycosyltransferase family 4 protein [Planococcus massiliensis]CEG21379.1 Alpha-monoglucosyldiacylglycerol synthase [Planococcus massiliensis]